MTDQPRRGRPRAFNDKTSQNTIQSLDRALVVMDHLAQHPGRSLSELAQDLSQSPATLYRVLITLETRLMVEMDPVEQVWHIGPGAFRVGSAFLRRTSLVERARPIMERLMRQTGETANLGVERGGKVLFLAQAETHESIRAFFPPGTQGAMHASGIGKAILSQRPEADVRGILSRETEPTFTPHSLATPAALLADLKTTQTRGYALDNEERTLGMRCIAAPVFGAEGAVIAGLSISGPISRVSEDRIEDIAKRVKDAASQLSLNLGAPHAAL